MVTPAPPPPDGPAAAASTTSAAPATSPRKAALYDDSEDETTGDGVAEVPAGIPIRLAARAIDGAVLAVLDLALGKLIGFGFDWLLLGALVVLVYFAALDSIFGTTAGKRILGLRVLGPDGGNPSIGRALAREAFTVLGAIPFAGPLLAVAAWVWIVRTIETSPSRQGMHDRLAGGTQVVRATG